MRFLAHAQRVFVIAYDPEYYDEAPAFPGGDDDGNVALVLPQWSLLKRIHQQVVEWKARPFDMFGGDVFVECFASPGSAFDVQLLETVADAFPGARRFVLAGVSAAMASAVPPALERWARGLRAVAQTTAPRSLHMSATHYSLEHVLDFAKVTDTQAGRQLVCHVATVAAAAGVACRTTVFSDEEVRDLAMRMW